MAKRFTSTEIWSEDWFLEMPIEYKLFWFYMLANCDHAGLFKVNLRSFCGLNEVKLSSNTALEYFNVDKQRIRVISESIWLVEDFFVYQYGVTFNMNNRLHESIFNLYQRQKIELTSIRGLKDLNLTSNRGLKDLTDGVKDKDKVNKRGYGGKNDYSGISATKVDGSIAFFEDGSSQELGNQQIEMLDKKILKVREIKKGVSY